MSLDQLRETTGQLLDLAGARARRRIAPVPQRRRRRRARDQGADELTAALDELYGDADPATSRAPGAAAGRDLVDSGQWDW